MITVNLPNRAPRAWAFFGRKGGQRRPTVVCLFSYRYDKELVPDLLENIAPFNDGWISWDDTGRSSLWYHEGEVRRALIEAARENGADWVLCMDPDERLEDGAKLRIRELSLGDRWTIWGVRVRELFSPSMYRVDGVWGDKRGYRLFALNDGQEFMNNNVHSAWYPVNAGYAMQMADINLYHLKMIHPENRRARAELYKTIDTAGIQEIGYDYLYDETGMVLESVPEERMYSPFRTSPSAISVHVPEI